MKVEETKAFNREEVEEQLRELGVEFTPGAHHSTLKRLLDQQKHVITQEDLDENPGFVDAGLEVGDEIYYPVAEAEEEMAEEALESSEDAPVDEEAEEEAPEATPDAPTEAETAPEVVDGTFTVKTALKYNGRLYQVGETVALTGTEAKRLIEQGVVA